MLAYTRITRIIYNVINVISLTEDFIEVFEWYIFATIVITIWLMHNFWSYDRNEFSGKTESINLILQ